MKLLLSAAALFLLLTPALAQQARQAASAPVQQAPQASQASQAPDVTAQPDVGQAGLSQADALAAAQEAEEQSEQDAEEQAQGQQSNPEQPYGVEQNAPQQSAADQGSDQPYDQPAPLPERRTLRVAPAPPMQPRSDAAAYPVHRQQAQLSVGAKLLSAREVEQKFSAPLGKRFLVVEVGVFPVGEITLRPQDFALRIGSDDQAFLASTPEEVVTDLAVAARSRRVVFFPTVGIGYSNGPWGRGVSTGVGVTGVPRPYPRDAMGANRRIIESELRDKSLPVGNLSQPVAGYLYFPVKEKNNARYNLELTRNGQTISLPLPVRKD